jgi:hypothetical protein
MANDIILCYLSSRLRQQLWQTCTLLHRAVCLDTCSPRPVAGINPVQGYVRCKHAPAVPPSKRGAAAACEHNSYAGEQALAAWVLKTATHTLDTCYCYCCSDALYDPGTP